ncbi:LOW QUALITY PROTEIN: FH1/FH2 domain-containing protein 3-like [Ctenocephalides felis]|uniref:LOW QUALITY PROTEIN: FH1/FH2 domain-containing protein 3-like n=1 Tax=Ctenocephalides felis TaxID=7515 RepID=UPI000E6E4A71|nr:LOW QUALITY PROTEIN: FH1/FH2 domain-containing protein 3-like [Ctenocephalides felis]
MLYVDGMNGVMAHNPTIQWLYTLIASQYRLVVKTALKLLLVFVEYSECNCRLLVQAVRMVDGKNHSLPWSHIMNLLRDFDNADTELLIYATSLLNKTLSGLSDQDSYYDETDFLERQGMEGIVQRYMSRPGTDLDLLRQLQVYEAVLRFEDGDDEGLRQLDDTIRKTLRDRPNNPNEHCERRKSRRHSTGASPYSPSSSCNGLNGSIHRKNGSTTLHSTAEDEESSESNQGYTNGYRDAKTNGAGVTPGLRRRRERAERQRSFIREQELRSTPPKSFSNDDEESHRMNGGSYSHDSDGMSNDSSTDERKLLLHLKRENTVKDLTQKLANQNILSPVEDQNKPSILENMTGLITKAKEGLAKSKSKGELAKSPSQEQQIIKQDIKKTENELHWEQLVQNLDRPLNLCDLDFTDLKSDEEDNGSGPQNLNNGPPPPPPIQGGIQNIKGGPPPPPGSVPNPPLFGVTLQRHVKAESESPPKTIPTIKKNKKTVKLFWKEVGNTTMSAVPTTIWDEMGSVKVDTHKLEHLFESRAKDLISKKQQEMNKNKEIIVLDHKRSNAINIAMTKLPPPRAIKAAILKMDSTVVTREGIEKLLNMIPSEEERGKIQEAQMANPELPLGSAEQFLLTLSSISELAARLKLWAFKLDFENSEREIAEPLMDLKQGMELLRANKTFRAVLSTLLSIGIFLNGAPVKGFQVEYLSKVPEVKDTVHKHSLLHHLCHMVMEHFPQATDLYSEIGPITRASKVDFQELSQSHNHLEAECKASWDRLRALAKHEEQQNAAQQQKGKIQDFLQDAAQRIILLGIVNRRVMNRYRKFLLWLGVPPHRANESKPHEFCRILSEFALEYRTTRERVLQQIEKKANHRERNKTRGKMITQVPGKFHSKEDRADAELRQLLGTESDIDCNGTVTTGGTLTWRRRRQDAVKIQRDESFTDGDDEILESLVKTATQGPARGHQHSSGGPRERKRTRHADRKSLKRSRTREGFPIGTEIEP